MQYEKKRSEARKHCQNFRPAADPLPGGLGRPKSNQLEMVTIFTYKPSLVRIDERPHAGSGVVRIDPLRFLAGCRTRRLNQA